MFQGGEIIFKDSELVNGSQLILQNDNFTVTNSDFYTLSIENSTNSHVENSNSWYIGFYSSKGPMKISNSSIKHVLIYRCPEGVILLEGCAIVDLRYEWSTVELDITNTSIIEVRTLEYYRNATMINHRFSDSQIKQLPLGSGANWTLTYNFDNTLIEALLLPNTGKTRITGSLQIVNKTVPTILDLNHDLYISREYPITVTQRAEPVPQAFIVLSNGNKTLWSGYTDDDGKVVVSVLYMHHYQINNQWTSPDLSRIVRFDNLTDTLTLRVEAIGQTSEASITVMSDTPVKFEFADVRRTDYLIIFGLLVLIVYLFVMRYQILVKQ